ALTRQAPLALVDNTFLSPFYASLLLQGADIVAQSLTKYINGHLDAILPSSSTTASPKSLASSRMHTAPYPVNSTICLPSVAPKLSQCG
ncbi:hypothetical protein CY34DRAFT_812869, partial [Suillus luteus UH-Slu-Lm8-n1]